MKKIVFPFSILFGMIYQISSAQIGIGTTTPHKSAILDIESTTKGFLPPRVANHNNIIDPAEGLIVYDESDNCLNMYNNNSWINLCSSSSSSSTSSSSSPNVGLNCNGAFVDISYGYYAFYRDEEQLPFYPFQFHLNADGSRLYNNYGKYYDSTSPGNEIEDSYKDGSLNGTVEVLAVSQAFPTKKWANFININDPGAVSTTGMLYLLSTDGELKSMNLIEYGSDTGDEQRGTSTSQIDPLNDDDVIHDPGLNRTDYRFTGYSHIVNDVDASIKFSSMYSLVYNKNLSTDFTIIPYDNIGKKFYSLGTKYTYGQIQYHTKLSAKSLFRKTEPTTVKESFLLKEADVINDILAGLTTEFVESTGENITLHFGHINQTIQAMYMITSDDYVNVLRNNAIFRTKFPPGVKPISITGKVNQIVLGNDGNLYTLGAQLTTTYYPNHSIETFNGKNYDIYEGTATLFAPGINAINDLNFKQVVLKTLYSKYYGLTTDSNLYEFDKTGILNDFNSGYSGLKYKKIASAHSDAVVIGANGASYVITSDLEKVVLDFPFQPIGINKNNPVTLSYALDQNGKPISYDRRRYGNYKLRLMFNCFGN